MSAPRISALAAATALCVSAHAQRSADLAAPIRLEADGIPIDTGAHGGHSGPLLADLDGDGDLDLLVGTFDGLILQFRNVGTRREPEFASLGPLASGDKPIRIHNW